MREAFPERIAAPAARLVSEMEFMQIGLETAGYVRWRDYEMETNIRNFRAHYGPLPKSCMQMWSDMQESENEDCKLEPDAKPVHLLIALRFLRKYPTETDLASFFRMTEKTVRKWVHIFVKKISLLLPNKMPRSLEEADEGFTFMLTVDGTHCPIEEPRPFSTIWSSFKLGGKPGVNYELGLLTFKPQLAWLRGPIPCGLTNDGGIFSDEEEGLMYALPPDRKCIGDSAYSPFPDHCSTANDLDPAEVARFKQIALARHENFNQRLKVYDCLRMRFRHGVEFHGSCFRAIAAILHYEIENGIMKLLDPYP